MPKTMNLSVRLTAPLTEFVSHRVGVDGDYDNASEYVRDLIRRDKRATDQEIFEAKKAALQHAFAAPDSDYETVTAKDVITRHAKRRKNEQKI